MAVLYAPLTPFHNDTTRSVLSLLAFTHHTHPPTVSSINLDGIPALAKTAADYGVTVVWTCGGMGEFYSLTLDERKVSSDSCAGFEPLSTVCT